MILGMTPKRLQKLVLLGLAAPAAVTAPAAHAQAPGAAAAAAPVEVTGIAWRADRPLTWADFRGPVDPAAARTTGARTSATLIWAYHYALEQGGEGCRYRITQMVAEATFDPQASWVRPGDEGPALLRHEQGHFDLAEVHKLMFDALARKLAGPARPCTPGSSSAEIRRQVQALVEPMQRSLLHQLAELEERYDEETDHGLDDEAQKAWNERIQRALESGAWE